MHRLVIFWVLLTAGCLSGQLDLTHGQPGDTGDGHDGDLTTNVDINTHNHCVAVASAADETIELTQAAFEPGRVVLVLQVQDGLGLTSGDPSTLSDVGDAGLWELARITSIAGTTLTVGEALTNAYDSNGARAAQACGVPEYTMVDLANEARIRSAGWDGTSGGVVAMLVQGSLHLGSFETRIEANGRGFRRGDASALGSDVGVTALDTDADKGGGKGEGVDPGSYNVPGRGNFGNGGGGGNALQAGGGGGGHMGTGGSGGKQNASVGDVPDTAGLSGVDITVPDRLLFGGGGGGGHYGAVSQARGGDGGGIVFIIAGSITGNGRIEADGRSGDDAGNVTNPDGAGGGGAGGTVYVVSADWSDYHGELRARGGRGGDVNGPAGDAQRTGPGGGGGGGNIIAPGYPEMTDVDGGEAGENVNATSNLEWGATSGSAGTVSLDP